MKTLIFQHRKWYAVVLFMLTIFANNVWGETWQLVSDITTLSSTDTVMILGYNSTSTHWHALKNAQVTTAGALATTPQNDSVAIGTSSSFVSDVADCKWVLEYANKDTAISNTSYRLYYIKSGAGTYYLINANNKTNAIINSKDSDDDKNLWIVGITASNTISGTTHSVTSLMSKFVTPEVKDNKGNVTTPAHNKMLAVYKGTSSGNTTYTWRAYAPANYSNVTGAQLKIYKKAASCTSLGTINGSIMLAHNLCWEQRV